MHRPLYTASFANVAVTAAQDLLSLIGASTSRIAICRIEGGEFSDAGDAQSELLPYTLKRFQSGATNGSGGTAPSIRKVKPYGRASVVTARANDTTQMTGGSPETILASVFNVQAGFLYAPKYGDDKAFDERIVLEASEKFALSLDGAPADSLSMSFTIMWEELGLA